MAMKSKQKNNLPIQVQAQSIDSFTGKRERALAAERQPQVAQKKRKGVTSAKEEEDQNEDSCFQSKDSEYIAPMGEDCNQFLSDEDCVSGKTKKRSKEKEKKKRQRDKKTDEKKNKQRSVLHRKYHAMVE